MTEENKNIDKFFADRLAQNQVEEDWNTPSDDIWLAAKPHFAKEEKSKRRFIFWIFGALLFGALTFATGQFFFSSESPNVVEEQQIASNTNEIIKEANTTKSESEINSVDEKLSMAETKTESKVIVVPSSSSSSSSSSSQSVASISKDAGMDESSQEFVENSFMSVESTSNVTDGIDNDRNQQLENIQKQVKLTNESGIVEKVLSAPLPNTGTIGMPSSMETKELKARNLITVVDLSEVEMKLETKDSPASFDKMMIIPALLLNNRPKQEVGLSHSQYLFEFFLGEVISEDDDNFVSINTSVKNVNVSHRRWMNKKFSYTYGANFSKMNARLDLDVLDTLDREDITSFVKDNYTIARRSSADHNEFVIELVDGYEVLEGDIINLKGNISISLQSVQLPFFFDYHIYRNRMEYLIGAGVTLDLLYLRQDEANISIFKDQQIVNKPLMNPAFAAFIPDYSLYGSLGAKFHLNKQINLGISTKISILEPVFSYAELGIYYRWHR